MEARTNFLHKVFFTMKPKTEALTPIIGSLLLLAVTILLASIITISVFSNSYSPIDSKPLMAKIKIESCEGGLSNRNNSEGASFETNHIDIIHEGGNPLPLNDVSIKISGYGNCFQGIFGAGRMKPGDVEVSYYTLNSTGKNPKYKSRNREVLKDNYWSVGEKLILYGNDSAVSSITSSVKANINGDSNSSDNYGFKANSKITLRVVDTKSMTIIAEEQAVVKHAG